MNARPRWFSRTAHRVICQAILLAITLVRAVDVSGQATNAPGPRVADPDLPPNSRNPVNTILQGVKGLVGMDDTNKVVHLLDPRGFNYFYSWIEKKGTFVDPDRVFSLQDGMLRISGQQVGFLATRAQYSDYKLVVEYKWGNDVWLRKDKPRNSGVFVHATGLDTMWMKSIECQIEEGSTGDIVVQGGASISVRGETKSRPWSTFPRDFNKEVEFPRGKWNTMEILCEGSRVQVKVNGHITNDGRDAYPNHGKIFLQSNGAEIFFRRIDLFPVIFTNTAPVIVTPPKEKPDEPTK